MTPEDRKKARETVISELLKGAIPALAIIATLVFFLRPLTDNVTRMLGDAAILQEDMKKLKQDNDQLNLELKTLGDSLESQKQSLDKYFTEQATNLRTQSLKLAYSKLFDLYQRNAGESLINKSTDEINRLKNIRDELSTLAGQITGAEATTAKFIFNDNTLSEQVGELYGSIYYAHLIRFLEDIIWRVYGNRGECIDLPEYGLCVSQIESDFLINSGIGEEWFEKTLDSLTEEDVVVARDALRNLDILLEGADDLKPSEVKAAFYESLKSALTGDELNVSFMSLVGNPKTQFSIYIALYDSGLLSLEKALLKYSPAVTQEYLEDIFDQELVLISFEELQDLASDLEAYVRTNAQLDSKALIQEVNAAKDAISSLLDDSPEIDAILESDRVEDLFIGALRWSVKNSSTTKELTDKLALFLGEEGKPSDFVTSLVDLENIYNIIESRLLIEASLASRE